MAYQRLPILYAAADPTANSDDVNGFNVGAHWNNTTTKEHWICIDDSTAAAVWARLGTIFYAAADPTANDDIDIGAFPGAVWINTASNATFVCVDNTNGAAIWTTTMTTTVYDADGDGIVDKAENVDDGAGNASTAAQVKGAVTNSHVQGTDQGLDTGGLSAVTAANAKDAVEKKHNDINEQAATTDTPVGASDYASIYDASGATEKKILLDNLAKGKRTIFLTAAGGVPTTTAGCAGPAQQELETNDVMVTTLDFADDASEYAMWQIALPDRYDGGTITAQFYWTVPNANAGEVRWEISGRAYANSDALDQVMGSYVGVTDTCLEVVNDLHISAVTAAITLAGSPAAGELVMIKVYRDHDHADDDYGYDAQLLMVKLEFGISKWSD